MRLREILAIGVLIISIVVLVVNAKFEVSNVEKGDAINYVLEDLRSRFPDADSVEIVSIEERKNEKGEKYYWIKAVVRENLSSPCPSRTNYYYSYPIQNFVPTPPEYVVKNCKICESGACIIGFEEEAIIASHMLSEHIKNFIEKTDAKPSVERIGDSWKVKWESKEEIITLEISKDAKIKEIVREKKE